MPITSTVDLPLRFDGMLRGDPTRYLAVRDGRGASVLKLVRPPARQPKDIVLTLDLVLQHIVERELDRAMRETGARWASAVLLDPTTGAVLALANRPNPDPRRYGRSDVACRRNRAVTDTFEPGSTFKMVTLAAALEANVEAHGTKPIVTVVPGLGIFAAGDSWKQVDTARHVYLDCLRVYEGADRLGRVRALSDEERGFIEHWEVEAYRKNAAAFDRSPGRFAGKVALIRADRSINRMVPSFQALET